MSALHRSTVATLWARARSGPVPPVFHRLRLALLARRQRQTLAVLDDAMLRDIGLTRAEALREAGRPVWDVPGNWLR